MISMQAFFSEILKISELFLIVNSVLKVFLQYSPDADHDSGLFH